MHGGTRSLVQYCIHQFTASVLAYTQGNLMLGETVVPMYVDQSRDALDADKSVFEVIAEGKEEVRRMVRGPGEGARQKGR